MLSLALCKMAHCYLFETNAKIMPFLESCLFLSNY